MKNLKKLMALVTALTLAFSLNITSFAAEETTTEHKRPVSSTEITLDADNAVTVTLGDTQAKFYRDTNEDGEQESQVYIRAQFAGETEYDLMKTVTIETGLPIGMQLIGDCFKENNIIRAAYAYEQTRTYERCEAAKEQD